MKCDYIWMDGELIPWAQATVHFMTPTLHYGTGIFEGIRCYDTSNGPAVFRLREHMQRLLNSLQITGIRNFPYSLDDLVQAVHQTVQANRLSSCYIRPLVYMEGPLGLNLNHWTPRLGIAAWEWAPFLGHESGESGVRLMVSSFTRHHPNVMMTKAKVAGNYVNSTLAKTFAVDAGFDETVLLDPQGYVAECSGENLFLVRNGPDGPAIHTPPRATILEGITRDAILTLARDEGILVIEEAISRDQLYIADELFLSGTAAELVPVREVDFRCIGNGRKGPVTRLIQQAFFRTLYGQGSRSAEWLDYVDDTAALASHGHRLAAVSAPAPVLG